MVSHNVNNLPACEGFVIFLTSKYIVTCYIDGFTLTIQSQSNAYLLNGSEQIHWISDLEGEVH